MLTWSESLHVESLDLFPANSRVIASMAPILFMCLGSGSFVVYDDEQDHTLSIPLARRLCTTDSCFVVIDELPISFQTISLYEFY